MYDFSYLEDPVDVLFSGDILRYRGGVSSDQHVDRADHIQHLLLGDVAAEEHDDLSHVYVSGALSGSHVSGARQSRTT